MNNIFNYDAWVKYYLESYGNSMKAKKKTRHPWTIELNKRFYEQEGYYLPTGKLITDTEKDILDELAFETNRNTSWRNNYVKTEGGWELNE